MIEIWKNKESPGSKPGLSFIMELHILMYIMPHPCVFCLPRSLQGRYRITPVPVLSWQYPARSWEAFLLRQKEGSAFQPYSSYQALPFGLIPFRLVLLVMTDSVMTTSVMAASGILIFPLFAHSGQHQQYTGHHHG